jgi:GNAT superfamily N-acetyltransferase
MAPEIRLPGTSEAGAIAELWHAGWHDAHAGLVPEALTRVRTRESFAARLPSIWAGLRVAGPVGGAAGLAVATGDELNQLYVAREVRGTGLAARLLADAEARLRAGGARTAWLACAIGNVRAARFYEKQGWHLSGTDMHDLSATGYAIPLEVWRYEKEL